MKYLLFACLMTAAVWGGTILNDAQFNAAVTSIGKADKMVLMIYTAAECPECAYMKQKVFHDKAVEQYLNQNFVVIEKNVHTSDLPQGYDYFGIPTMFFINKAGEQQYKLVGSKRPKAFLDILHELRSEK